MVTLDKIHHIGYFTDDLEGTIERYGKAFPLDNVVRGHSAVVNAKIAFLYSGGTIIEVMEPENRAILEGKTGMILHHTAYEVDNLAQAMQDMEAAGTTFRPGSPAVSPVGKIAYLADTHLGSPIHLIEVNKS